MLEYLIIREFLLGIMIILIGGYKILVQVILNLLEFWMVYQPMEVLITQDLQKVGLTSQDRDSTQDIISQLQIKLKIKI